MEALYADQHYNLVVECREGNRKAQYELYNLYSKGMYNVALRMLNNEDDAADVLQESFLDAFIRIGDFRQESSFGWWIKQIVVNKSITLLRKKKLDFISIEDEGIEEIADAEEEGWEDIEFQVKQVRLAIQLLRDNYRVILSLYLLEGYDHEEIGYILNISENTSRTQLLRAKRKLIEVLKVQGMNNN
ncbi:RNA polymerase sigma factor [Desertivirga xinjiangensis]|uniref:RNA polymerase sigma factor n=1 Tax=Desertivirga xinjiangensis TaxID=539206 RepID=UPI00210DB15C|nr:sigma-70 family RNA polymerase sigma factor [Pedobacter xinjiangensis]